MKSFLKKGMLISLAILGISACAELQTILGDVSGGKGSKPNLSQQEVIQGLKNALEVGTDTAVSLLSRQNGYFRDAAIRILLPQEINDAVAKLRASANGERVYQNTIKKLEDDMVLSFNRAAETASAKATPIFKDAIRGMTIQDGFAILRGSDDAATQYLHSRTFNQLASAFKPDVRDALKRPLVMNMSSERIYNDFVNAYNMVVDNDKLNLLKIERIPKRDLSAYVVERALDGLFAKVAEEEKDIRSDPAARVTAILRKVFGA